MPASFIRSLILPLLASCLLIEVAKGDDLLNPFSLDSVASAPRKLPPVEIASIPPAPIPPAPEPNSSELATGEDEASLAEELSVLAADPVTDVETAIDELAAAEEPPIYVWYQPAYWFGPIPWDTGIELGINGSSGTSNSFSIRTGGYVKRKSEAHKLAVSLFYNNTSAEGELTQSNALFDGRRDWLFQDSPWSLFGLTQIFYDEFQAFDLNVNVNGGLGYKISRWEHIQLGTSIGAGASREFGGPEDDWVPEAQFGVNYEQQVYEAHKIYAKFDYFPEFENFGDFRVLSDIGMELELSRPSNLSLKISATDRFDSDPNGVSNNNTNYSVLLLWKL